MIDLSVIRKADPELCAAMEAELKRQRGNIELIASENIVSPAVLAAAGSHLTNKYAEGLPGKRYYGGCQYVDVAENLAPERLKALVRCEHRHVQPPPGAPADLPAKGKVNGNIPDEEQNNAPAPDSCCQCGYGDGPHTSFLRFLCLDFIIFYLRSRCTLGNRLPIILSWHCGHGNFWNLVFIYLIDDFLFRHRKRKRRLH